MLRVSELRKLARARLVDAHILLRAKRFDAAVYSCGFAIELALKARICRALKWPEFPETSNEFRKKGLTSFKTHDLDLLLRLSSVELRIKQRYGEHWGIVSKWDPESRYNPLGRVTAQDAEQSLVAARQLLRAI